MVALLAQATLKPPWPPLIKRLEAQIILLGLWRDRDARATLKAYASTYEGVGNGTGTTSDLRVRKCGVQEEVDGPFRPTLYISPALDAAETHHMPPSFTMAPFCEEPRPRAEFE